MSDIINHWVPKTALTRSLVEGTPATALCGETLAAERQSPGTNQHSEVAANFAGSTEPRPRHSRWGNRKASICPECELFYNGLQADVEAKDEVHA